MTYNIGYIRPWLRKKEDKQKWTHKISTFFLMNLLARKLKYKKNRCTMGTHKVAKKKRRNRKQSKLFLYSFLAEKNCLEISTKQAVLKQNEKMTRKNDAFSEIGVKKSGEVSLLFSFVNHLLKQSTVNVFV